MLKVLHGADFHLDSPFSGLKPDAAARRRGEQRELLARLTDLAREREADLVLLSGDLLDGDLVFRETVQALARALGEIPCPVFLAPGNHDWYGPQSPYAALEWPGNVHLFTGPELGAVRLPELGCTVWGAAFCAPRQSASPCGAFMPRRRGSSWPSSTGRWPPRGLRPHLGGGHRRQRAGLPGPGPCPPVQRPAPGRGDFLGLPRLPRGAWL